MQNEDNVMYEDALEKHSLIIEDAETGEEIDTYINWKLISKHRILVAPPEPKYNYEETAGIDGDLDVSEDAADRVLYNNRKGSWDFYLIDVPYTDNDMTWDQTMSAIMNFLQGKLVKVYIKSDPDYYWFGRLSASASETESHRVAVTLDYSFDPYKYEKESYDSGTKAAPSSVTTAGSPMPVIPTLIITSSKFAFHQHDELTRGEAIYMLYNLSAAVSSGGSHWPVTITESKFLDVNEDDYYYDAVLWAEEYNITSGISDKIFGGGNICTRAQFVTMLYAFNWMGSAPTKISGNTPFSDVKINSYYFNPVKWAFTNGYIIGDGNGHFMPNEPITRQHACAIIYKYRDEPTYTDTSDIIDLAGSETIAPWYYVAVVKLYNEGIVSGYADGTYKPGNYITRGQFVTMLYAAAGSPSVAMYSIPFDDVTSGMYCYNAVKYCYTYGYISGTSETTFSPERAMLRKEMIQVLFLYGNYQAIGNDNLDYFDPDGEEDNDDSAASGYEVATDVPVESYYFYAVAWGVINGITTLNAGNMFYPDQKATRAMAAQMLYKLMKILNDWEDDDAATIDQEGSYSTVTNDVALDTSATNWRQGYYDSSQNDLISNNNYIRTVFFGLSDSDYYGEVSRVTIKCPSAYKFKLHWFSYVDSSTQTFRSETIWTAGNGYNKSFSKPSGASHCMVSVTSANTIGTSGSATTEDWSYPSSSWRQGRIESDGSVTTSNTSYVYTNGYTDVTGIGLDYFNIETTSGTLYAAIFYYDSSRNLLDYDGYGEYDTSFDLPYDRISASEFPSGTKYIRWCVTTGGTTSTSDGAKLKITASLAGGSGGDAAISPEDGESLLIFKTFTRTTYIPPVTDITKYTVDYSDAIKSCYDDEIVDDPMIERAPMGVTLENSKGTKTATVPSGEGIVPELLVVDGENTFTVEGNGTYSVKFKRGSL